MSVACSHSSNPGRARKDHGIRQVIPRCGQQQSESPPNAEQAVTTDPTGTRTTHPFPPRDPDRRNTDLIPRRSFRGEHSQKGRDPLMASAVRRRSYPKRKCNSQVFGDGSRVDGRRRGPWAGGFPRFRTRAHSSRVHLPIGGISRARGWTLRGVLILYVDRLESRPRLCEQ